MKKVSYFAVILLLALSVFNSCSDKDNDNGGDQGKVTLDVFPKELSVAAGGEGSAFIVTSNSSWTITDMPEWISLDMENGNGNAEVTVTAEANEGAARSARLTVAAGSGSDVKTATVTIEQSGITEELEISESAVTVAAYGGSVTFDITSNVAWTVSKLSSDDWITEIIPGYGSGNGQVTVVAAANTSENERSATLTVSSASENTTRTVNITQIHREKDIIEGTWDFTAWEYWRRQEVSWTSEISYMATENGMEIYVLDKMPYSWLGIEGTHKIYLHKTKDGNGYFVPSYHEANPVGSMVAADITYELYQTMGVYPERDMPDIYILNLTINGIQVTDTSIIIPKMMTVYDLDGTPYEMYCVIGSLAYISYPPSWISAYGEFEITRSNDI